MLLLYKTVANKHRSTARVVKLSQTVRHMALFDTFVPTMREQPYILAIESSCDDTGAAVLHGNKVLSNIVASQAVHEAFGGVVPELASRAHQQNIVPVVDRALKVANIDPKALSAIAFTQGPGLMGSLLVGSSFAKSLSLSLDIPLIPVHHMKAHVMAHLIEDAHDTPVAFPFLCLTVSGGHTQLVHMKSATQMEVIGNTIDDAAGEAFDKAAKLLGLPYPGGPQIDKLAAEGNPKFMSFGKPKVAGLDFSFSGLKTSFLYKLQAAQKEQPSFIDDHMADICASYQHTIITLLMDKVDKAMEQTGVQTLAIAGGVSANKGLRAALQQYSEERGFRFLLPPFQYTTDNAAMIGISGYYAYLQEDFAPLDISTKARLSF